MKLMEEVFETSFGIPHTRGLRRWSREKVREILVSGRLSAVQRMELEAEMRRREAWDAPAGKAYWLSVIALLVSAASLAVAIIALSK